MTCPPRTDDVSDLVQREATRVADRLRAWGEARLAKADPGERSPADLAHGVARQLADLAADSAGRPRPPLPRLADHGAGDQVAVLALDLLAEGDAAALTAALHQLTELRRAL